MGNYPFTFDLFYYMTYIHESYPVVCTIYKLKKFFFTLNVPSL